MDDLTLAEKWLAGLLAVGGVVVAWANRDAKLTARVTANERDIKVLKEAHDQKLHEIQQDIHALRTEVKADVKALWDRTEERHNRLDGKLDRLLEREKSSK